jgi:hypothetical protein
MSSANRIRKDSKQPPHARSVKVQRLKAILETVPGSSPTTEWPTPEFTNVKTAEGVDMETLLIILLLVVMVMAIDLVTEEGRVKRRQARSKKMLSSFGWNGSFQKRY